MDTLLNTIIGESYKKTLEILTDAEKTSIEKYKTKEEMIKSAKDLSTKEKLEAMDQNYDRKEVEQWKNALLYTTLTIGLTAFIYKFPIDTSRTYKSFSDISN